MEKIVIICDRCGKDGANKYSFAVDRETDAAGDDDTIYARVDLCPDCERHQLELFILALPWTARKVLVKNTKDKGFYLSHMSKSQRLMGLGE